MKTVSDTCWIRINFKRSDRLLYSCNILFSFFINPAKWPFNIRVKWLFNSCVYDFFLGFQLWSETFLWRLLYYDFNWFFIFFFICYNTVVVHINFSFLILIFGIIIKFFLSWFYFYLFSFLVVGFHNLLLFCFFEFKVSCVLRWTCY